MTLTLTSQPGFAEVPPSALDAGQPLTAANIKAISSNAGFGAVWTEEFWGFYKDGETIVLPVSPADGYEYAREELHYIAEIYWTGGAPSGELLGTHNIPSRGVTGAAGTLLEFGFYVNPDSGLVSCDVHYYVGGGAQSNTHDGILIIHTIGKRQR